jgi:hypothetical protein
MVRKTHFVEIRVVARSRRNMAGGPHAVPGWTMLIHTCHAHAEQYRVLEKSLSERHDRGIGGARHVMSESNTAAPCKSNGTDTI